MTIKMILMIFLFFFVQPLFLVGLFYAFWNRRKRLAYVRETYRMNFNRSAFEFSDYFFKALVIALIASGLSLLIGVPLTLEWYFLYQGITILLLVFFGSRFIHPVFTFSLTSLALFLLNHFDLNFLSQRLKTGNDYLVQFDFFPDQLSSLLLNSLFFITILLFLSSLLMKNKDRTKLYPILRESKRGKRVAKYQNKWLWLLPLLLVVPGSMIEPIAPWWPLLSIGGEKFGILLLPILLGFQFTISTQLIEEAIRSIRKDLQFLALFAGLLFLLSYFYPAVTVWTFVLLLIAGVFVLYRHRQRENKWTFKYGPSCGGLRVISVKADSPADRMGLTMGAVITHMNDKAIDNKEEFYEILSYNRSYVKLRLERPDGEVIMTETPLYDDDANHLGLLLL
ncbi:MAG: PDZ domain-containing protein [Atopostipes sp.]|nr:PDZ domain-containing protein [Atopostipes sp.]